MEAVSKTKIGKNEIDTNRNDKQKINTKNNTRQAEATAAATQTIDNDEYRWFRFEKKWRLFRDFIN